MFRDPKLLNSAKSLKLWRVNQSPSRAINMIIKIEGDESVDGIANTFQGLMRLEQIKNKKRFGKGINALLKIAVPAHCD
jgi:hypothetical protein